MKNAVVKFLRDEEGATAIEYGLIAGLISIGIIVVVTSVSTNLGTVFTNIATELGLAATK